MGTWLGGGENRGALPQAQVCRRVLGFILAPSPFLGTEGSGVPQGMLGQKLPCVQISQGAKKQPSASLNRVPPSAWVECSMVLINRPHPTPSLASKDGLPAVPWGGRESGFILFVSIKMRMQLSPRASSK